MVRSLLVAVALFVVVFVVSWGGGGGRRCGGSSCLFGGRGGGGISNSSAPQNSSASLQNNAMNSDNLLLAPRNPNMHSTKDYDAPFGPRLLGIHFDRLIREEYYFDFDCINPRHNR